MCGTFPIYNLDLFRTSLNKRLYRGGITMFCSINKPLQIVNMNCKPTT